MANGFGVRNPDQPFTGFTSLINGGNQVGAAGTTRQPLTEEEVMRQRNVRLATPGTREYEQRQLSSFGAAPFTPVEQTDTGGFQVTAPPMQPTTQQGLMDLYTNILTGEDEHPSTRAVREAAENLSQQARSTYSAITASGIQTAREQAGLQGLGGTGMESALVMSAAAQGEQGLRNLLSQIQQGQLTAEQAIGTQIFSAIPGAIDRLGQQQQEFFTNATSFLEMGMTDQFVNSMMQAFPNMNPDQLRSYANNYVIAENDLYADVAPVLRDVYAGTEFETFLTPDAQGNYSPEARRYLGAVSLAMTNGVFPGDPNFPDPSSFFGAGAAPAPGAVVEVEDILAPTGANQTVTVGETVFQMLPNRKGQIAAAMNNAPEGTTLIDANGNQLTKSNGQWRTSTAIEVPDSELLPDLEEPEAPDFVIGLAESPASQLGMDPPSYLDENNRWATVLPGQTVEFENNMETVWTGKKQETIPAGVYKLVQEGEEQYWVSQEGKNKGKKYKAFKRRRIGPIEAGEK